MSHPLLGNNYHYDTDSGRFINAKHQRIAEIIHDYNPELSLMWITPELRDETDIAPYVVVHTQKDGRQYPVFYVNEDELDERVLQRIFYSDMSRTRPKDFMTQLEAQEAAAEILRAKEIEDKKAEAKDFATSLLKSPLNTFRHGGRKYS